MAIGNKRFERYSPYVRYNQGLRTALPVVLSGTAATLAVGGTLTVTGASTFTGAQTMTGAITPTGGVAAAGGFTASPRTIHTGGEPAIATTSGTNTDIVTTETYIAEVFVPCNMTLTGVNIFNGTAVAGNLQASLASSAGAVISAAQTASTAASGTTAYQRIPFAAPYAAVGPATYYIMVQGDNTGGDVRTHTVGNFTAQKQTSQTYGTFTTITVATTFTTAVGPIASLY